MFSVFATLSGHVFDDAKRPLLFLLVGFILTFVLARLNTRITRARGGSGLGVGSIVTAGGLHIHHSVFGIIGMVVAGIMEFALQPGSPWLELFALVFGSGTALTLDEFALILHLEDVYWTGEGRTSIDAVILGVTFITLLLTGLTPRSISEVGDLVAMSRWVGSALILSGAAFVIVSYLKGKLFLGTVGIFVPPVAVIGALRLAKPSSPWAHRRYADNPGKLERARRRDEGFHQRWRQRKHRVWDVIGGKPHLHLPYRRGRHDDHGNDPGSSGSRV
jgi:lysyl-tRNA synthetase class 2